MTINIFVELYDGYGVMFRSMNKALYYTYTHRDNVKGIRKITTHNTPETITDFVFMLFSNKVVRSFMINYYQIDEYGIVTSETNNLDQLKHHHPYIIESVRRSKYYKPSDIYKAWSYYDKINQK